MFHTTFLGLFNSSLGSALKDCVLLLSDASSISSRRLSVFTKTSSSPSSGSARAKI